MGLIAHANDPLFLFGCGGLFLIELDSYGFYAQCFAGCASDLAVFHPLHPALVLHVRLIADVVVAGNLAHECEPYGLHAQRLAVRSHGLAIAHDFLPADVLDVRLHLDVAVISALVERDLHRFHAQRLAVRAGFGPVGDCGLPADVLNVRLVGNARLGALGGACRNELLPVS